MVNQIFLGGPTLIGKGEKKNDYVFSKHRPFGPMLSISRNVRLSVFSSVRLFVRLSMCSLLRYRLYIFLERNGLRFEHFYLKVV